MGRWIIQPGVAHLCEEVHRESHEKLVDWFCKVIIPSKEDYFLLGILLQQSSNGGGARLECDVLYDFIMERDGEPWFCKCLRHRYVWEDK